MSTFAGQIKVYGAGLYNGTVKATLRDDEGLVAEVYVYGNNDADIERVKQRGAVLAAAPVLLAVRRV